MHQTLAEIVEQVEADRHALIAASGHLTQAQLDYRLDPERWSVGENLDHLALVEKGIARILQKKIAEAQASGAPAKLDAPSQIASLDQYQITGTANRRRAPDGIIPRHAVAKAELFDALEQTRRDVREAVNALADYDLSAHTFPHPFIGALNLYQWLLFIGQHERRHLNQINSILTDTDFPAASEQANA